MDIFQQALKQNLTFSVNTADFNYNNVGVQDIYRLSLEKLDALAYTLQKELEAQPRKSFIKDVSPANATLQLKFDIVYAIIQDKLQEREAREKAAANKQFEQKLMTLIAQKEEESLASLSVEELQAMLNKVK